MSTPRKAPADRLSKRAPVTANQHAHPGLVEITSRPDEDVAEPIPVFAIDGVLHTMPAAVPASITLQALDRFRHEGEIAATAWMLEEVLGTESYTALKECRWLTSDQLAGIMDKVNTHVMGALESTGK